MFDTGGAVGLGVVSLPSFPLRCGFLSRKSRRFSAGAEMFIEARTMIQMFPENVMVCLRVPSDKT